MTAKVCCRRRSTTHFLGSQVEVQIVKRSDARTFKVLQKRYTQRGKKDWFDDDNIS